MPTAEAVSDYEKERGKPTPNKLHSATQKNLIVALARYEPKYTIFSELTLGVGRRSRRGGAGPSLRGSPYVTQHGGP
ncbi:MAG: hypothetical protein BRD45_04805 [Bacteroidetes bacterium QS_8_64_10]|nr:MAG: hypothetical protein BRD45_04805 [Bacteroidetes bacterium QS_8_64_10]